MVFKIEPPTEDSRDARRTPPVVLAILWMLGIGAVAVAAGAFVGFLVNGPPQGCRSSTVAAAKPLTAIPPPSPPPNRTAEIVDAKPAATATALAAPSPAAPSPANPASADAAPAATPDATQAARDTPSPPAAAQPATLPTNPGQLASGEVMELQSRLRAIGFKAGPIDGSAGPMTVQAVKQYQQARRLAPTGTVDRELLAKLRQERPGSSPPGSTQQAQAPPPRRESFMQTIDRLFRRL